MPQPKLLPILLLAVSAVAAFSQETAVAKVAALKESYGLRSITGDAVTLENLGVLEDAYSRFPAEALLGMEVVLLRGEGRIEVKKADADGNTTIGKWQGLDENGEVLEPSKPMTKMAGGRVTHFIVGKLKFWGAVHEAVHHLTIYADPAFGRNVLEALGYSYAVSRFIRPILTANWTAERSAAFDIRPSGDPVSPRRDMDLASWRPGSALQDHWFPTSYSRKKGNEHLTEVITAHLARDRPNPTDAIRADYDISDNAALQTLLQEYLGPGGGAIAGVLPEGVTAELPVPSNQRTSLFGF